MHYVFFGEKLIWQIHAMSYPNDYDRHHRHNKSRMKVFFPIENVFWVAFCTKILWI